ncbi:MAG: D-alanine--D-alanine ligase [Gemmatimonadaceae bacterium]|nr:D-alanine--D-alanine ligase [Gemmatimonadaceae bacterium]
MKRLRILALMYPDHVPPESLEGQDEKDILRWRAEYDVITCLKKLGHRVLPLGVQDELQPIRDAVAALEPHVVFNLLEEFHWNALYDHNIVSFLELMRVAYTGCNPRGLVLSRGKALSKKLLAYHRIPIPAFAVFPLGRRVKRPPKLGFPLIVKSLTEHASLGIARASLVDTDEELAERVRFIHENVHTDAIAEQFIDGRELYSSVLGNTRLQTLPTWELVIEKIAPNEPLIATAKVKHDLSYQARRGVRLQAADLPEPMEAQIGRLSRRIYRVLELSGYARIDYRLDNDGVLWFLDANPNPDISESEEVASAAKSAGMGYGELIQRIVSLGMSALK